MKYIARLLATVVLISTSRSVPLIRAWGIMMKALFAPAAKRLLDSKVAVAGSQCRETKLRGATLLLLSTLAAMPLATQASTLTWTLTNAVFSDGTAVTGYINVDTVTGNLLGFDIQTGGASSFQGTHYSPTNTLCSLVGSCSLNVSIVSLFPQDANLYVYKVWGFASTQAQVTLLTFGFVDPSPFTDPLPWSTGGAIPISNGAMTECVDSPSSTPLYTCGSPLIQRSISSGTWVAPTAVPEPADAWLLGAGLACIVGVARRRKAA